MRGTIWSFVLILCLLGPANPAMAQPAPPPIHAASAILIEARTGAVLFAKDPDRRLPPASTTKILTALLLAQSVPPGEYIPISPAAAATPGSDLGVHPGEKRTAKDLLYAILLVSANDASTAAAERIGGTTPAFVARMNSEAMRMGTTNTHFVNPHGLEAPNHYSSARDLARIARQAIQNPLFAAAAQARTYPMPGTNGYPPTTLTNKNELLGTVEGMDGIKTGYTKEAGRCFVGSATRKGRRLITVVLNSPDWQGETAALLNYGFQLPNNGMIAVGTSNGAIAAGSGSHQQTVASAPTKDGVTPALAAASRGNGEEASPLASLQPGAEGRSLGGVGLAPSPPAKRVSGEALAGKLKKPPLPPSVAREFGERGLGVRATGTGGEGNPPQSPRKRGEPSPPPASMRGMQLSPSPQSPRKRGEPSPPKSPSPAGGRGGLSSGIAPSSAERSEGIQGEGVGGEGKPLNWRGLLLFLALFVCLLLFLFWLSRRRRGAWRFPMIGFPSLFAKRKRVKSHSVRTAASQSGDAAVNKPMPVTPPTFRFTPPVLERREGRDWLETLLGTPNRLMEPALRRQACALLDADPNACIDKILGMLAAPSAKLRLIAAELLALQSPRRAEETLQAMIEDERTPTDIRSEAIQQMADMGGDRHERLWMQMLVRDGSAPAARSLAALPRLEATTTQALRHVLSTKTPMEKGGDTELKGHLRNANIACVLGAHGAPAAEEEIRSALDRLPANHRDQALVSTLRGIDRRWAVERLVETALHGHAFPALQALMECDPMLVRSALEARLEGLEGVALTRARIAQWLLLGEGDPKMLRQFADAGDSLATGALNLGKTHRWEPSSVAPDALLAATMIVSLRLGFSRHTPEEIASAFRGAASGEGTEQLKVKSPELGPLAEAYANPDVYDAVQMALHTDDGVTALLAAMARHPENAAYQQEMAFWLDKTPRDTRLLLTHALSMSGLPTVRTAVEARTADGCPGVRSAAQRSLHARPSTPNTLPNPIEKKEEKTEEEAGLSETPLNQAA